MGVLCSMRRPFRHYVNVFKLMGETVKKERGLFHLKTIHTKSPENKTETQGQKSSGSRFKLSKWKSMLTFQRSDVLGML